MASDVGLWLVLGEEDQHSLGGERSEEEQGASSPCCWWDKFTGLSHSWWQPDFVQSTELLPERSKLFLYLSLLSLSIYFNPIGKLRQARAEKDTSVSSGLCRPKSRGSYYLWISSLPASLKEVRGGKERVQPFSGGAEKEPDLLGSGAETGEACWSPAMRPGFSSPTLVYFHTQDC